MSDMSTYSPLKYQKLDMSNVDALGVVYLLKLLI